MKNATRQALAVNSAHARTYQDRISTLCKPSIKKGLLSLGRYCVLLGHEPCAKTLRSLALNGLYRTAIIDREALCLPNRNRRWQESKPNLER